MTIYYKRRKNRFPWHIYKETRVTSLILPGPRAYTNDRTVYKYISYCGNFIPSTMREENIEQVTETAEEVPYDFICRNCLKAKGSL